MLVEYAGYANLSLQQVSVLTASSSKLLVKNRLNSDGAGKTVAAVVSTVMFFFFFFAPFLFLLTLQRRRV